jgi:hypothetical protein
MSRPPFEVADIIRISGDSFRQRYSASLTWPQRKVLDAVARCRTAALGGHRDACADCGHQAISYNSCRNRHCPKCQTGARDQWLAKRQLELLAIGYYHLVFSVPHMLVPLMWQNKRQLFSLLFEPSAAALLEVAVDPKHLGAEVGFLAILHSWGQTSYAAQHAHRRCASCPKTVLCIRTACRSASSSYPIACGCRGALLDFPSCTRCIGPA